MQAHRDLAVIRAAGNVFCPLIEAQVVDPTRVRVVALDLKIFNTNAQRS